MSLLGVFSNYCVFASMVLMHAHNVLYLCTMYLGLVQQIFYVYIYNTFRF